MENFIIICLLIIAVGLAIIPTIRHFKGHGGCCGGSSYKPKKKKLKRVIQKKTFKVEGMHCEHCAMSVTKALNQIDGVRADVSLSKGRAVISYDREVAEEVLKNTVEKAGYKVSGIS